MHDSQLVVITYSHISYGPVVKPEGYLEINISLIHLATPHRFIYLLEIVGKEFVHQVSEEFGCNALLMQVKTSKDGCRATRAKA